MTRSLEILVVVAAATLCVATFPLWRGDAPIPQVPLFAFLTAAPRWVDVAALVVAAGGLTLVLIGAARGGAVSSAAPLDGAPVGALVGTSPSARWRIVGWSAFLVAVVVLVDLSQQRWQPWVWQFWLLGGLFVVMPAGGVVGPARLIVIGVYLHSAVSKLDASFLQSHGPQLVDGLLGNVGAALPARGVSRTLASAALPCGEFACAALLLFQTTRRVGLVASIGMHLALMAALGPWGLDHRPGVLLWNGHFIAQNLILFRRDGYARECSHDAVARRKATLRAAPFVLLATALPVVGWFERIDPWLGWGLYSSRHARVRFFVDESAVERLPAGLRPFVEPAAPLERWRRVRLDRWSLATLGAPLSPQSRVQVGVALGVVRAARLGDDCRLIEETPADRWTGRRTSRTIEGVDAIEARANEFHANARPRGSVGR